MTRIRFDGCDLSPAGHPGGPRLAAPRGLQAPLYDRGMSVDVLRWEGLLEGEELAYLGEEPAREARFAAAPGRARPARARRDRRARALRAPARGLGRRRARRARASSRPAPRPGRRSRSTCPCSTRSRASRRTARSTSTRRRRSRRISSARSSGLPDPAAASRRSTTATRRPSSAGRSAARSNVILSNPDMLHVGVLPHHDRWGDVLANLRYVVVDEAHVYRGVFGSHVANVLRRLRRLARIYGAEPQFLLASATISNPGELGADAARRAGDGGRRRRGAARRAHGRALEPAAARRGARAARLAARRGGASSRRCSSSAACAR